MATRSVNIAIEGCCHGELDNIYASILSSGKAVDLLLVCGDFESLRDEGDLSSMAVPLKYRHLNSFKDYYQGTKVAPVLTIFIGGNHEASNVLHELYYGGWVAPNIYFLGFAGVVIYKGLRICGISGIHKQNHYKRGHYERFPYSDSDLRSIYHIRELEVYRLMQLQSSNSGNGGSNTKIDVFLSHEWPQGIWNYGDCNNLLRKKKHLEDDMRSGALGSLPLMQLLLALKPTFWFAAHLHVKFAALLMHPNNNNNNNNSSIVCIPCDSAVPATTRFLALDKVLPGRDFIQFLTIPVSSCDETDQLCYDIEWLAILKRTHHLLTTSSGYVNMPPPGPPITEVEKSLMMSRLLQLQGSIVIPTHNIYDLQAQSIALHHILEKPQMWCSSSGSSSNNNVNSNNSNNNGSGHNIGNQTSVDLNAIDIDDVTAVDEISNKATDPNLIDIDDV